MISMKTRRIVWILLLAAAVVTAQENPFLSSGNSEAQQNSHVSSPAIEKKGSETESNVQPGRPARQGPLMSQIARAQRGIYESLAGAMQRVKEAEESPQVLLLVVAGAFLYGILHALGPGHRKTVLFSYFMAEEVPLRWGVGAGVMMGMLHGAAAALIILPLYYLLKGSLLLTFNEVSRSIELGTFAFIALFGAVMLIVSIVQMLRHHDSSTEEKSVGDDGKMQTRSYSRVRTLLIIVGSSLVPCPGAAMILLFALSLQMTGIGLLTVLSMSAGMSLTLSMVALVTLRARISLQRIGRRGNHFTEILHHGLELGGYLLITVFGLIMTLGMLQPTVLQ